MTIYAIGDVHGHISELDRALRLIEADGGPDARIVFLGDYTDRGPDSRGVLDRLIEGRDAGRPWTFLMGNHDRMFLRYVSEGIEHDRNIKSKLSWLNPRLGGTATLASYGIEATRPPEFRTVRGGFETLSCFGKVEGADLTPQELVQRARDTIPEAHIRFLGNLELYSKSDGLLFVHAGIRPGVAMADQHEDDLVWIRDGFLEDPRDHGFLVVHGHTALDEAQHCGNRVNLDSSAGYGLPITAARFDADGVWVLGDAGPSALRPA